MIGRATILVDEIEAAKRFYLGILGFEMIYDGGSWAQVGPAGQPGIGVWLMQARNEAQHALVGRQTGGEPALVMYTDDCRGTAARLAAQGVRMLWPEVRESPEDAVIHFADLYGNPIVLVELKRPAPGLPMVSPVRNRIGAVFLKVRDVAAAREWYSRILGLRPEGEIQFGHLWTVPMESGPNLVLDSRGFTGPADRAPAFHFNTADVATAYEFMVEQGVEVVGGIEHGQWFLFKDPDGTLLMVCQV